MEIAVSDAIIEEQTDDAVLARLVDLASYHLSGRTLFPDFMKAPAFFIRSFVPWVKSGMEGLEKIKELESEPPPHSLA